MQTYNGHRSYNAWNISLWIGNDESLYRFALECISKPTARRGIEPSLTQAVNRFMEVFRGARTPDGVPYTRLNVRLALEDLQEDA